MTSDPFMLCIEALTVLTWGPLSFLAAFAIIKGNTSLRHITQTIVSVGHLYGVALYFGTCFFQEKFRGISYSRPETLYYWVYYVGMNAPWVIVPASMYSLFIVSPPFWLQHTNRFTQSSSSKAPAPSAKVFLSSIKSRA